MYKILSLCLIFITSTALHANAMAPEMSATIYPYPYPPYTHPTSYQIVEMDLCATDSSQPVSINNNGQVTGHYYLDGEQFVFIWSRGTGLMTIDLPAGANVIKINNRGQIAGNYYTLVHHWFSSTYVLNAYLWDPVDGFFDLGTIRGQDSYVKGLTDDGTVLMCSKGECTLANKEGAQKIQGIVEPSYIGLAGGYSIAINNSQQIAYSHTVESAQYGSIWVSEVRPFSDNVPISLPVFDASTWVTSINDYGYVTGEIADPKVKGFWWNIYNPTNYTIIDGFIPKSGNIQNILVGDMYDWTGNYISPGIWSNNFLTSIAVDYPAHSPWKEITRVYGINDQNAIIATGWVYNKTHAVLLIPNPETVHIW